MLVAADLGLDPWDVLHQGLATSLGLPLGAVVVAVSLLVLAMWIPLREHVGLGTVLNAVAVGFVFEAAIAILGGARPARTRRVGDLHHPRHQPTMGRTAP